MKPIYGSSIIYCTLSLNLATLVALVYLAQCWLRPLCPWESRRTPPTLLSVNANYTAAETYVFLSQRIFVAIPTIIKCHDILFPSVLSSDITLQLLSWCPQTCHPWLGKFSPRKTHYFKKAFSKPLQFFQLLHTKSSCWRLAHTYRHSRKFREQTVRRSIIWDTQASQPSETYSVSTHRLHHHKMYKFVRTFD